MRTGYDRMAGAFDELRGGLAGLDQSDAWVVRGWRLFGLRGGSASVGHGVSRSVDRARGADAPGNVRRRDRYR